MACYEYRCDACGRKTGIERSMSDGPVPAFSCPCGNGNMQRMWHVPMTIVKGFRGDYSPKLPGINLAAYQRSNTEQMRIYDKVIDHKRTRDRAEHIARGTSRKKENGRLFRRVGSIPRELLVAESRSNEIAPGKMLKEHGKDMYQRHGCWWGDKGIKS